MGRLYGARRLRCKNVGKKIDLGKFKYVGEGGLIDAVFEKYTIRVLWRKKFYII